MIYIRDLLTKHMKLKPSKILVSLSTHNQGRVIHEYGQRWLASFHPQLQSQKRGFPPTWLSWLSSIGLCLKGKSPLLLLQI